MKKKVEFSAACEIRFKKIVREENELEKNENKSDDGVVDNSKEELESIERSVRNFELIRNVKGVGE